MLATIFAILAKKREVSGMATAGVVLGIVTIVLSILMLVAMVIPPFGTPIEQPGHELIGTWNWTQGEYEYIFNEDGTGRRGRGLSRQSFNWFTPEYNYLRLELGGLFNSEEHWTYTIEYGVLTINSKQIPGMAYSYNKR